MMLIYHVEKVSNFESKIFFNSYQQMLILTDQSQASGLSKQNTQKHLISCGSRVCLSHHFISVVISKPEWKDLKTFDHFK